MLFMSCGSALDKTVSEWAVFVFNTRTVKNGNVNITLLRVHVGLLKLVSEQNTLAVQITFIK